MERRVFLTGLLALAGAAALGGPLRVMEAMAAAPSLGRGILDELDAVDADAPAGEEAPVLPAQYRRRRRRRVWRQVCHRVWRRGRPVRVCTRRRVWVWY